MQLLLVCSGPRHLHQWRITGSKNVQQLARQYTICRKRTMAQVVVDAMLHNTAQHVACMQQGNCP